jgi:hypothetical protein
MVVDADAVVLTGVTTGAGAVVVALVASLVEELTAIASVVVAVVEGAETETVEEESAAELST